MATLHELFLLARQRHEIGDLAGAEPLYRQVLQVTPQHADAWHLLGVLATHQGRNDLAQEHIGRALSLRPDVGAFHLNLGVARQMLGQKPEALASFQEAVRLAPNWPKPTTTWPTH